MDHHALYHWFQTNKRTFPWRENKTPYSVWVSEVMLQQTRAPVVVPYFLRWMEAFPSVEALASASIDLVIKLWEGLGYYQRARNLHLGARQIVEKWSGTFPKDAATLLEIQGIGPYTAKAIAAFAFESKDVPIDGNVQRVLARYFCIEEEITSAAAKRALQKAAKEIEESGYFLGEALIELGALICGKKPNCFSCPLKKTCSSRRKQMQEALPYKAKKIAYERLKRAVFLLECRGSVAVRKNTTPIMKDLFEFPYTSWEDSFSLRQYCLVQAWDCTRFLEYDCVRHTFTRFRVTLRPYHLFLRDLPELEGYTWVQKEELHQLPFSSGHRKILQEMIL
ncbi:MAG: A/G-specific adenine glycosylase [Chlamydiota bacterium]